MTTPLERLTDGHILVADGAMGTLLIEHGLEAGRCPELINLERPELLQEIAGRYLDAGADIVHTNTFGASPLKLAHFGLDDRTEEINRQAVRAARAAIGDREAFVSASCGPSGRLLEPYGDIDPGTVQEAFRRQIAALVDAEIDLLTIETMTDLAEATLAVKAARSVSSSLAVAATMTFDVTPRGIFTIMGNDIEQAALGLTDAGADILGANCGNGSERMVEIAAELRRATDLPLLIQSNAGPPRLQGDRVVYEETPELWADSCTRGPGLLRPGLRPGPRLTPWRNASGTPPAPGAAAPAPPG
jgi:5-methyltetrahydrofolate--homocysteine methyltransferase